MTRLWLKDPPHLTLSSANGESMRQQNKLLATADLQQLFIPTEQLIVQLGRLYENGYAV